MQAIMLAAEKGVTIQLHEVSAIIDWLSKAQTLEDEQRDELKATSLDEWPMHFKKFENDSVNPDNFTLKSAWDDILSRHVDLDYSLESI